jgi:phosphatidylserine decarboxylase
MKIHREGIIPIIITCVILITGFLIAFFFMQYLLFKLLVVIPITILLLLILWFFRIPKRIPVKGENLVIAPADGKIVVKEKIFEEEYFHDERIQISIFMSPLDVHQNVYPLDGKVVYYKYHQGRYLVAWHPKSSAENERSTLVIQHNNGQEILVRQIAGAVARRICTYSEVGSMAQQGDEFGFIRFGSRVDVILPVGTKTICRLNEKAINKHTVLAELV